MWTSGDVGFEVAIKDGNNAMCCSEGEDSDGDAGSISRVVPDATEGDGDGGSCTLLAEDALPLDLLVSSMAKALTAEPTNSCQASASSSSQPHHSEPRDLFPLSPTE